jgi:hypothetical protein
MAKIVNADKKSGDIILKNFFIFENIVYLFKSISNHCTMKRTSKLFVSSVACLLFGISSMANIAEIKVRISEIAFDSTGNWIVELGVSSNITDRIDSILFESSTGQSKLLTYEKFSAKGLSGFDLLYVVKPSDMNSPFYLNRNGDFLCVKTFSMGVGYLSFIKVAFGDYIRASTRAPKIGESISYITFKQTQGWVSTFAIDASPTIGVDNDSVGCFGYFKGFVIDQSGSDFNEGFVEIAKAHDTHLTIQPGGRFYEAVPVRNYITDTLGVYPVSNGYKRIWYAADSKNIQVEHNAESCDTLYLKSTMKYHVQSYRYEMGVEQIVLDNRVIVTPNPITNKVIFYIQTPTADFENAELEILDPKGQTICKTKFALTDGKYEWLPDSSIPSGLLLFRITLNNTVLKNGKLVRL